MISTEKRFLDRLLGKRVNIMEKNLTVFQKTWSNDLDSNALRITLKRFVKCETKIPNGRKIIYKTKPVGFSTEA